jgi:dolichol-phosphate mannosyltransferase|tara:strand:- start:4730 stop:5428 length:699 start_codon:yes stop_codon:yes gene_type:complete
LFNFSIVIPIFNEEGNIENLIDEIFYHLKGCKNYFEVIIIDDCSEDNSFKILETIKNKYKVRIYRNKSNMGQSFCIYNGIEKSSFNNIVTIDGDGQNNPKDILKLLKIYQENNLKLVCGIRKKRKDSFLKIISSKIANKTREFILKDKCQDTGCSLKIFDKKVFLLFKYFDGIHRFIPALFSAYSLRNKYVHVEHRRRKYGSSKYGTIDRLFKGIIDLIRVYKIIRNIKNVN